MKIGILAVQGDFAAHAAMLEGMGIETVEVRTPADMEGCDGLILPGGESTTQLQFLQEEGLAETIKKFAADGHAVFGTCAGAISVGYRRGESEAGIAGTAGHDGFAQWLRAANCERCFFCQVDAEG